MKAGRTKRLASRWPPRLAEAAEALETFLDSGEDPAWRTGPPHATDPEAVAATSVRAWFEGSISLSGLCAARGIPYVHVLQPAMRAPGSKPLCSALPSIPTRPARWWTLAPAAAPPA